MKAFQTINDASLNLNFGGWADFTAWGTPDITNGIFTFTKATGELVVSEAGIYLTSVSYWGTGNTSGDRTSLLLSLWKKPNGGSYSIIDGAQIRAYGPRNSTVDDDDGGAALAGLLVSLSVGDAIKPQVGRNGVNIDIAIGGARFTVIKAK